ncbi:O-acetyl-ADP-ribose deacetylase (regulator of RNase III), contains Macro domain [Selenomonas ruminantium]|uniref:O-acetyl-ADP-ribose deacetylase (Regulator of RNase III), contains Macro domain n=1 Tax=Selenomonas ruminantium TaxID=971 RepID=A0A1M6XUP8_SELRU|nr:protein-ADP-ribose hydrolase [Selenomonas ruminantium]SHL09742.1 O-acetyl-ADP-ribose deacetylase (regulator of RNase III), contains Macro domain [Selenomonas ruminantium]
MNTLERIQYLNTILLEEMPQYKADAATFPDEIHTQRRLLRSLMNLRPPGPITADFLREQDILLQQEATIKGVVKPNELPNIADETSKDITPQGAPAHNLILWQGDITRLAADGIVNAANSAMLGCFAPCHGCIDNAIHSAAGLQLREACAQLMEQQGQPEPTGQAKITPAYNLPSKFVLHTVGPIIPANRQPNVAEAELLASCYRSCLKLAAQHQLKSIAFCCISTGEFHYPREEAAQIALNTVSHWLASSGSDLKVIFNVFKDEDLAVYKSLLKI